MARNMKCSVTGKDVHFTEHMAERAARQLGAKSGKKLYTYRCRLCSHWHLTHQDRQSTKETA